MDGGQIFQTFSPPPCDACELMHVMSLCACTEQASVFESDKAGCQPCQFFRARACMCVGSSTLAGLKKFTGLCLLKAGLKILKPNVHAALIRLPSVFLLFPLSEREIWRSVIFNWLNMIYYSLLYSTFINSPDLHSSLLRQLLCSTKH